MEFLRLIRIAMVLLLPAVRSTGIQFQLSPNNINLENPTSNFVDLTCSVTETSAQVVTFIKLFKESNSGSSWDQIAAIIVLQNASFSSSLSNDFRSIMQVSGRLATNPVTDSQLVVRMNASLITCLHVRKYRCELSYLVGDDSTRVDEAENVTLQATASPSTPYIETVKNLNTNLGVNVAQGDTSTLSIQEGEQLEIVCKADLGTDQSTIIQWDYNSASGSGMIGYNGYKVNSEPVANTSGGAATSCRYTRTSTMRYNISDIDSARSSSNPLIFSCYIQSGGITTQNNPMYTVTFTGSNDGNQAGSTANAGVGGSSVGAIVGGVIGGLLAIIIIIVVVWLIWFRKGSGESYKTKEEYGSDNPNMAPPVDYAVPDKSRTRRGHENRGLDEPHESNSRRRDYHNGPGRSNFGMDKDFDDYDSRDGSPTFDNDEIGHMGVDPIHGSIGTGV